MKTSPKNRKAALDRYHQLKQSDPAKLEEMRAKTRASVKKWRDTHPEERMAADKAKYEKFKGKYLAQIRVAARLRRYGLTQDAFDAMFAGQNGCCAICETQLQPIGKGTHVDHDHSTGLVRGILCAGCNFRVGVVEKSPDIFLKIGEYLQRVKR